MTLAPSFLGFLVRGKAYTAGCVLIGSVAWMLALVWWRPSPFDLGWGVALLLLAPLVLVPLGLRLADVAEQEGVHAWLSSAVVGLQLPAAVILLVSFALPVGWPAAILALPWFAATTMISLAGLVRVWRRGLWPPEELCLDAGLIYLAVGAGWAVLARLGARPLDFEGVIVLLTSIHFHYAGFVLPVLTGLAGRALGNTIARVTAIIVTVGVPSVAVGITTTQLGWGYLLESLAAWLMALGGLLSAWLHLKLAARRSESGLGRSLLTIAALSLAASMVLAALYGSRFYAPIEWLDIPWMRAWHGTANAFGFGLAGLSAWTLMNRHRARSN